MSPQDAEHFVAEYLKFYGATGVSVTRFSRDGGIDVETTNFVAQVKHVQANVGVKAVREIYAIAVSKNKEALFFAKVGYTKDAIDFATQNRIALFTYLPHLQGYDPRAKTYLERGMACPLDF
jgi:HJR/Mrr/RecB family endonuclease